MKYAAKLFKRNTLCHGVPFVHTLTVVEEFVYRALVKTKAAKHLYSRKMEQGYCVLLSVSGVYELKVLVRCTDWT